MKVLAYLMLILGLVLGLLAGITFFAAWSDYGFRGCPGAEQCADAVSVMILTGCAVLASVIMLFAAVVFARR